MPNRIKKGKPMQSPLFLISLLISLITVPIVSSNVFAEEALMLPEKVWRLYHVFSSTKVSKKYDLGGDKASAGKDLNDLLSTTLSSAARVAPKTEITRYDLVVEYGHTDKIAFQLWLPFYLDAETDMKASSDMPSLITYLNNNGMGSIGRYLSKRTQTGSKTQNLGDILVGSKWQLWNTGSSANDLSPGVWRFAAALGAYLPTGKVPDATTANIGTTESGSASLIPGFRTYLDYQVARWFYINWFTETRFPLSGYTKRLDTSTFTSANGLYKPGNLSRTELEFDFAPVINDDWSLDGGMIFFGTWTARGKYSDFSNMALNTKTDSSQYYGYKPYAGVFYTGKPMPIRTTLSYAAPFAGHNENIKNTFALKVEMFLKF